MSSTVSAPLAAGLTIEWNWGETPSPRRGSSLRQAADFCRRELSIMADIRPLNRFCMRVGSSYGVSAQSPFLIEGHQVRDELIGSGQP